MSDVERRRYRPWAIALRVLIVPIWYPFAALAWLGNRAESVFWWIERLLPNPSGAREGRNSNHAGSSYMSGTARLTLAEIAAKIRAEARVAERIRLGKAFLHGEKKT